MSETKKLFVLVQDAGDGSYSPQYTFNEKWIEKQEERHADGKFDLYDIGVDGDGFHYDVLTVPADTTLQSLGIAFDCAESEDDDLEDEG